ncbi:uncharacterized protein, partial [Centruroides vittatus]|uniref:uncharacterized protein n=1 Tax=Centruroides vittatus TaxID=120091 RepID=UPI00350EDFBC
MYDGKIVKLANRLSLDLIIILLIIAGVEPNPGPFPRSPQQTSHQDMQKKGRGRPRKESSKDEEKEIQQIENLSIDSHQIEEENKQPSVFTKEPTIHDYFEPVNELESQTAVKSPYTLQSIYELIQDNFSRLNIEIQSIKSEVNTLKEEYKCYKKELTEIRNKLQELDKKSEINDHLKGMFEFEFDKLANEKTKKNIIIINYPFATSDYLQEIISFINNELKLKNIEIEGLIKLNSSSNKPIVKIILESINIRNLILKEFWSIKPNLVGVNEKKIIFTADLCRRSRIRKKHLQARIKLEKSNNEKIIVRDDYYIKDNLVYTRCWTAEIGQEEKLRCNISNPDSIVNNLQLVQNSTINLADKVNDVNNNNLTFIRYTNNVRNKLLIGFWNIQGLRGKMHRKSVKEYIKIQTICGFTETWIVNLSKEDEETLKRENMVLFSGAQRKCRTGRPAGGLLLLIKKYFGKLFKYCITDKFIFVVIELEHNISICWEESLVGIVLIYLAPSSDKKLILNEVQKTIDQWSNVVNLWLIGGDFNARIGELMDTKSIKRNNINNKRISKDKTVNADGRILLDFAQVNEFFILNGRLMGDIPAEFSFVSPMGKSIVDYIICSEFLIEQCNALSVLDKDDSDHFPVRLEVSGTIEDRNGGCRASQASNANEGIKLSINKVKFCNEIMKNINDVLLHERENDPIGNYNLLMAILDSYRFKKSSGNNAAKYKNKWFDNKCYSFKIRKQKNLQKFRKANTEEALKKYLNSKKAYNNLVKAKKKRYYSEISDKLIATRDTASFWSIVNGFRGFKSKHKDSIQVSYSDWLRHFSTFSEVYKSKNSAKKEITRSFQGTDFEEVITVEEIQYCIGKLKENSAPGSDLISNYIIKNFPIEMVRFLTRQFNGFYTRGVIPVSWNEVTFAMIFKHSDRKDPINYRPIALLSGLRKVFTAVLMLKFNKWIDENNYKNETQYAYIKNGGTQLAIFILIAIVQLQLMKKRRKVFALFVDLEKAYDSVSITGLQSKMTYYHASERLTEIVGLLF